MKEFLSEPFNWVVVVVVVVFLAICILLFQMLLIPQAQRDFDRRNSFMQICTQSENYNRDECIRLAGKLE